jgi:DNA recombination protein RmuC
MPDVVLVGLISAAVGLVVGWLVSRAQSSANAAALVVRLAERDRQVTEMRDAGRELAAVRQERDRAVATLAAERASTAEKIATLEQLEVRVRDAFGALSHQALQANNATFMDLAKTVVTELQSSARADLDARQTSIDQLVKPVQERLQLVDEKLQAFDKGRAESAATLQEHLRAVAVGQQQLFGETHALVSALRAPQVRGQWGEMQLKRVVELAGMEAHCDFDVQTTVRSADGTLRPDMVVWLPGKKRVVVDSKTPILAYLDAMNAADDVERGRHLDRHARQIREHVEALASKQYAEQFSEAPDFVVLFLPGESFFSAACQRDPSLIEFAVSRGVIPASPTTLITVLKAVAYGWQQERIGREAEAIRDLGIELYDRVRVLAEHLGKMRKGLESAVSAYNGAVSSIETRLLPTARRFRERGVTQGEEIDVLEPVDGAPRLPAARELVG